ncbi:sodium:solute symporter family transporter [Asticcacaulis sp. 201]|uniref:sodium:solute symporter family transporter n=1 Tax=Asticcacaulis sp. 201 TaxID=3028787 RepID=UPI002915D1F3|nr:sodium/solute symporter [Asticcacaulis sp. 201]MDV6330871.1 sodium/solute symporter [Asticcacaulis sp. 201]
MPLIQNLSWLDLGVFGLYVGGLILMGVLDRRRQMKAREHFLGGNSASWPRIGFALYASTISATSLVGLTGAAYSHGISVYNYEWMAAVVLTIFCAFVLPTYIKSQVFTVPEFLELRYGKFVRTYVSALSVVLGIFLDAAGGLFAGAVLFQILFPDWVLWQVCALLALLAGAFLISGGLRAVIMVESVQGLVMVIAASGIAFFTFQAAGGWNHVMSQLDPAHLKLVMPASDKDMPWTGLLTGVPLIGFYFWCTNQIMVQRVLAAKSLDHGRWGSLMGGALKLTNLFLVILPGAAAVLLFPHLAQPDQVFSHIVFEVMPHGLIGLILAACLISILANLSAVYNSTSTLLTMDFIRKLRPGMTDVQLVRTGKIVIVALMVISVLWTPQIIHFQDTLWKYLQAVLCYFVPPIAAVFLAGLFIKRVNTAGAAAGLIVGTTASLVLFVDAFQFHVFPLHFLVAAVVIFVIAGAALLIGSLFRPAPDPATVSHLMFAKDVWKAETDHLREVKWYQNYRILSVALLILTGAIVVWFA